MTVRRYVVEAHARTRWRRPYWTIEVDGERAALLEAIDAAQLDGLRGVKTEVTVRSEREGEVIVWVSGRDAYPPNFSAGEIVRPE